MYEPYEYDVQNEPATFNEDKVILDAISEGIMPMELPLIAVITDGRIVISQEDILLRHNLRHKILSAVDKLVGLHKHHPPDPCHRNGESPRIV
jgi:hypothetical protein